MSLIHSSIAAASSLGPSAVRIAGLALIACLFVLPATAQDARIVDARPEQWIDGPDLVQPGSGRNEPDVAVDARRRAIHVWHAFGDELGNRNDIFLRRIGPDDVPLEDPRIVNTTIEDDQLRPRVAVNSNGWFYVVWQSDEFDAGAEADRRWVRGQLFDSEGQPHGSEHLVSHLSPGNTTGNNARVAALDDDSFVVVWDSRASLGSDSQPCMPGGVPDGCDTKSVQARLVGSDGTLLGDQFQVNLAVDGWQHEPAVAGTADGGFLVVWHSQNSIGSDSSSFSVQARQFNSNGSPSGSDFQVNTTTTGAQYRPEIARTTVGSLLVVYESPNAAGDRSSIRARHFGTDVNPTGNDFQIPTSNSADDHFEAEVAGMYENFLVAWRPDVGVGTDPDRSINARIVRGSNLFTGAEFQVNTFEDTAQGQVTLGGRPDEVVFTWRSASNPLENDDSIRGLGMLFCELFCDDFETSDPSRWDAAVTP